MIECNLCGFQIKDDYYIRVPRHERFHVDCHLEGRNTCEGMVKWIGDIDG